MRYALVVLLLAGCNQLIGFDDGELRVVDAAQGPDEGILIDAEIPDAEPDPDAPAGACDPYAQTGCGGGQKCTWIHTDTPNNGGIVGCVPDGAIAIGGACSRGVDGPTTGFDDCVGGSYCTTGQCKAFCTMTPDSCGGGQVCGLYAGLLGDPTDKGLCDFTCDPVTQVRTADDAGACGSAGANQFGCYKYDESPATCLPVHPAAASLMQDATAYDWPGSVYRNGCAPGYMPMGSSAVAGDRVICTAYCRPMETSVEAPSGSDGVPGSGFTCSDRGATSHECRFFWGLFEQVPTAADNGIGFCMQPANYVGDWDNNPATADTPLPACATLSNTDTNSNGIADNYEFSCAPYQ